MPLDPGVVQIAIGLIGLAGTALGVLNTYLVTKVKWMVKASASTATEAVATAKEAVATADQTKDAMVNLEKHTNSIKDALVKVTGESEFRKGFALGSGSSDPSMAAFAQLAQRDQEHRDKLAAEALDRELAARRRAAQGSGADATTLPPAS